jgi:hypothetical protein
MVGFLDKKSSSEREGLIEKSTHTSDMADSIINKIAPEQTILVHIPVWTETPDPSRCNTECMERVRALLARGELYIPLLEDIIQTSTVEADTVFIASMLEIEN